MRLSSLARLALHLTLLLVLSVLLGACALSDDRTWQQVTETGVLRVGTDASYPPFEYVEGDGRIVGFDADVVSEIGQRLGVQVELVNISYDSLYDALITARVDLLASALVPIPSMEEKVSYSVPYFNAGQHLVVPIGSPVQSLWDMEGQRLAVEFGSEGDAEARRWQRRLASLIIVRTTDPEAALQAVMAGEADAALVDGISARLGVGQHEELAIAAAVDDRLFALAVGDDSPILLAEVNKALREMQRDGTLETLIERWFGPQR